MLQYITPTRYRESGLGVEITQSDAELRSLISIGSTLVNRYCAVPTNHDFRGGTVTAERHRWRMGNVHQVPIQRVYPRHRPIISVETLTIDITNTWSLALNAEKLYVNPDENWVEPIGYPYTTYGFIAPFGTLPIGLRNPVARLDYTYGWEFDITDEELVLTDATISSATANVELQASAQFWLPAGIVEVKQDGTELTPTTDYTVDKVEGTVTIGSYDPAKTYTASYTYTLPTDIAKATQLVVTDLIGQSAIASSGLLGLSGIKVEEIELRQSSKVNFYVEPINAAARILLTPYVNLNWGGP